MLKTFRPNHPVRQIKSFKYAFEGLFHAILTEPNFRIQLFIVALSVYFGKKFELAKNEWVDLVTILGLLLIVEILNTALEEVMDHFLKEPNGEVKIIKDLSAAAVLITSFVVLINLILIFGSRLVALIPFF